MKVAVWGSYNHGNYGDDIMAIQFATYLKSLGVEPWLYRLNRQIAKRYDLITTDSIEKLINGASFCIIGGGGLLVETLGDNVEEDFKQLNVTTSRFQCPVFPISIGGSGKGSSSVLSYWQRSFFQSSSCQYATVRLEEDISLLNSLGKEAEHYPDVLLSVGDFWRIPLNLEHEKPVQVGINLPDSFSSRLLLQQLRLITAFRKDIVFHFIRTFLPDSPNTWELIPQSDSPYIKQHIYSDPTATLKFLTSLDLVISSKLHLGLTALALKVPFFSVGGPGKAHSFLRTIDADFAIYPSKSKLMELGLFLSNPNQILAVKDKFNFEKLEGLKRLSWQHLKSISRILENQTIQKK